MHTALCAKAPGDFHLYSMEVLRSLGRRDVRMTRLIGELPRAGATVTPTLHVLTGPLGLASAATADPRGTNPVTSWPPAAKARSRAGYADLAGYVLQLHPTGVPLSVGTDAPDPGRTACSGILLLRRAELPIPDALHAATFNGARALELEAEIGTIEQGKRAHLILLDANPLQRPEATLGATTIIKVGVVFPLQQRTSS